MHDGVSRLIFDHLLRHDTVHISSLIHDAG